MKEKAVSKKITWALLFYHQVSATMLLDAARYGDNAGRDPGSTQRLWGDRAERHLLEVRAKLISYYIA